MTESQIIQVIAQKDSDKEKMAEMIAKYPDCIPDLLEGLSAEKGRVRFGCEKVLRHVSEKNPELVYPYFDEFVKMLDCGNNVLKWGAIITIANLASVDSKKKFDKIFSKYYSPISGPVLITAANVIGSSVKIALAKPRLVEKITKEILKVEKAKYKTTECRRIACGHAIKSFDQFFHKIKNKEPVVKFVKKQLKNKRAAVQKKAAKFIRKHKIKT